MTWLSFLFETFFEIPKLLGGLSKRRVAAPIAHRHAADTTVLRIAFDVSIRDPRAHLRDLTAPGSVEPSALRAIAQVVASGRGAWTHVGAGSRPYVDVRRAREVMHQIGEAAVQASPIAIAGEAYRGVIVDRRVVVVTVALVSRRALLATLTAPDADEVRRVLDGLGVATAADVYAAEVHWSPVDLTETIAALDLVANDGPPRMFALDHL